MCFFFIIVVNDAIFKICCFNVTEFQNLSASEMLSSGNKDQFCVFLSLLILSDASHYAEKSR